MDTFCRRPFSLSISNKEISMLDAEEEYMLAKNWRENGNLQSAHKLVTSHLRLAAVPWDIEGMDCP